MKNPKATEYFNRQTPEHQAILQKLREIIFNTLPETSEGFAWGVPVYEGGRIYLAALKKQVNIGFSIIGLTAEEIELFEGSGKTARHIKVPSLKELDEKQLIKLIKLVSHKTEVPK